MKLEETCYRILGLSGPSEERILVEEPSRKYYVHDLNLK